MNNLLRTFMKPFVIAGFLCFGIIYAQAAWSEPSQNPPSGNVDAPVNIGGTNQIKSGGLGVSSLSVYGNQYTQGNLGVGVVSPTQKLDVEGYVRGSSGLCIGNDCRSSWSTSDDRMWQSAGSKVGSYSFTNTYGKTIEVSAFGGGYSGCNGTEALCNPCALSATVNGVVVASEADNNIQWSKSCSINFSAQAGAAVVISSSPYTGSGHGAGRFSVSVFR